MAQYDDFWGDIDLSSGEKFPADLLKFQANLIGTKTDYLLRGEIETSTDEEIIYNTFYIIAPKIENYRYALLKTASTSKPYPIFIYDNSRDEKAIRVQEPRKIIKNPFDLNTGITGIQRIYSALDAINKNVEYVGRSVPEPDIYASNYKEFEDGIRTILSSKEVNAVIHSLIAQSKIVKQTDDNV